MELEANQPHTQQIEQLTQPRSCAWLLHGLNTKPEKMNSLLEHLKKHSPNASVGVLSGHQSEMKPHEEVTASIWRREFSTQWNDAISDCSRSDDRRIFVGYSLGALTALSLLDGSTEIQAPTHMILIAPALKLRKKVALVKMLSWLPFGALPSPNHKDYRARDWTSFSAYNALFELNNAWQKNSWKISRTIPTVLFLAKEDELVDSQSIAEKVKEFPLWKNTWISNETATLKPAYHHLILDEASVGKDSWAIMKSHIDQLLRIESKHINDEIESGD